MFNISKYVVINMLYKLNYHFFEDLMLDRILPTINYLYNVHKSYSLLVILFTITLTFIILNTFSTLKLLKSN